MMNGHWRMVLRLLVCVAALSCGKNITDIDDTGSVNAEGGSNAALLYGVWELEEAVEALYLVSSVTQAVSGQDAAFLTAGVPSPVYRSDCPQERFVVIFDSSGKYFETHLLDTVAGDWNLAGNGLSVTYDQPPGSEVMLYVEQADDTLLSYFTCVADSYDISLRGYESRYGLQPGSLTMSELRTFYRFRWLKPSSYAEPPTDSAITQEALVGEWVAVRRTTDYCILTATAQRPFALSEAAEGGIRLSGAEDAYLQYMGTSPQLDGTPIWLFSRADSTAEFPTATFSMYEFTPGGGSYSVSRKAEDGSTERFYSTSGHEHTYDSDAGVLYVPGFGIGLNTDSSIVVTVAGTLAYTRTDVPAYEYSHFAEFQSYYPHLVWTFDANGRLTETDTDRDRDRGAGWELGLSSLDVRPDSYLRGFDDPFRCSIRYNGTTLEVTYVVDLQELADGVDYWTLEDMKERYEYMYGLDEGSLLDVQLIYTYSFRK